ncbi:putative transposase [Actimicrobium sp. GrIS 1.19]|uniref:RNA-guided endonuclease InsQ/TnpB family protein n=1 Tax=Actimicrobium sp. GrIS 1.19 TaxID=3071708 RepID=UPI002DFE8835|nr:putative transposase [Actimicrobium sp. GrIS 1.19]
MIRRQAFKYELMPNGLHQRTLRRFGGACRFVFNKALALQQDNRAAGGKFIRYESVAKLLTGWRHSSETPWLADAPNHPLQHALKDLDRAYQNFFAGRADFPTFKKKGRGDSFRYPDAKQFKVEPGNARIFLPKLGWIRYRNSRDIVGSIKNITVSTKAGKWFVSIQTEREVAEPVPVATDAVGVDVGITRFATLSDGSCVAPLDSFKKHQQRLAKYQRRMSRKVKFSSNWKKAKAKVTQIHVDIGNVRNDFLHKATTTISNNHALVAVEDLKIVNMTRSSKGTIETPGTNVRAKAGLNRAILDQGWGEFGRQLEYKLYWNGGYFMKVSAHHTSQTCPCCGHVDKDNRKTQSAFLCTVCWYENNADVVGAINVLDRALAQLSQPSNEEGPDTARIACEVNGAVRPSAAGTHRSDVQEVLCAQ